MEREKQREIASRSNLPLRGELLIGQGRRADSVVGVAGPSSGPGYEAALQRPKPRAVPLYSQYYANKPGPIFRGLRYHIHKTTPSHIFGWLRSLLIVSYPKRGSS